MTQIHWYFLIVHFNLISLISLDCPSPACLASSTKQQRRKHAKTRARRELFSQIQSQIQIPLSHPILMHTLTDQRRPQSSQSQRQTRTRRRSRHRLKHSADLPLSAHRLFPSMIERTEHQPVHLRRTHKTLHQSSHTSPHHSAAA